MRNGLRREGEQPRIGVYRPSLLPSCLRRQFLIYKRGVAVSEEKAGLFEIGRLFHEFLGRTFRDGGLTVKAVEAPFFIVSLCGDELIKISGRAGLIISLNGEDYIIETKSIRNLPREPLRHHVEQLQFYLAGYGLTHGFLIYLEKSFLKSSIFPVSFSLEDFRRLLNRAALLHKHLTGDLMPEPDAEKWECWFCEFKEECGKNLKGGGGRRF
ncbi:hypothetical protein KEJ34_07710 [Candidatus Bathyarchaeota archaeon]|nr:hypothetical protein [Candidatus Bathyarchaeota archaeon]